MKKIVSLSDGITVDKGMLEAIKTEKNDLVLRDMAEAELRMCLRSGLRSVRDICNCQAVYIGVVTDVLTEALSLVGGGGVTTSPLEDDFDEYSTY